MGNLKRQSFEVRCTYKTTKNITSTLPNVENKNSISETKDNKTKRSTITKRRQLQHTRSLLLANRLRAHHTYYRLIKIGFSYSTYNLFWDDCTVNQNLNTDRKTSRFDDQSTAFFCFLFRDCKIVFMKDVAMNFSLWVLVIGVVWFGVLKCQRFAIRRFVVRWFVFTTRRYANKILAWISGW
jgi:hypothetical protein